MTPRPWRMAVARYIPPAHLPVSRDLLEAIAAEAPSEAGPRRNTPRPSTGRPAREHHDPPQQIKADVLDSISFVSADVCYDEWRNHLAELKNGLGDEGEAAARQYSQSAPHRYDETIFLKVWRSLDRDGDRKIASWFHAAREGGWKGRPREGRLERELRREAAEAQGDDGDTAALDALADAEAAAQARGADGTPTPPQTTPHISVDDDPEPPAEEESLAYTPPYLGWLPAAIEDYILAGAETLGVDPGYVYLPLITSLAAAIGASRDILVKPGFTQPAVLWTCLLSPSSSIKTPALELATLAHRVRERELARENVAAIEGHRHALARWEAQPRKTRGPRPLPPPVKTVLCDDLTLASLVAILAANLRGILVSRDEIAAWLASFDAYTESSGADLPRWLSLHSGTMLGLNRRTEREHHRLFAPRVSIAGCIQPTIYARLMTREYRERGLAARLLVAYPPARKMQWSDATVPDRTQQAMLDTFAWLWALQPDAPDRPAILPMTPEARECYTAYYNRTGEAMWIAGEEDEAAALGKSIGGAARLALISHCAHRRLGPVEADIMEGAVRAAAWHTTEAARTHRLLAESAAKRAQRQLVAFIERRGGAITVRELQTYYRPLKASAEAAERALDALAKAGLATWRDEPTGPAGGHPKRVCVLCRDPRASASAQPNETKEIEGSADNTPSGPREADTPPCLHNPPKPQQIQGCADADRVEAGNITPPPPDLSASPPPSESTAPEPAPDATPDGQGDQLQPPTATRPPTDQPASSRPNPTTPPPAEQGGTEITL